MYIENIGNVPARIKVDYERYGIIFLAVTNGDTIHLYRYYDLKEAIDKLRTNPMYIFVQYGTAKKLGVI